MPTTTPDLVCTLLDRPSSSRQFDGMLARGKFDLELQWAGDSRNGVPFDLDCSCPASRNLPKSTIKPLHNTADAIAIVQMYDVRIHD